MDADKEFYDIECKVYAAGSSGINETR